MNIGKFPVLLFSIFLSVSISKASDFDWSTKDKEVWNKAIKRVITTPPCCGACPILRMEDGHKIYGYLTDRESIPEGKSLFEKYNEKILEAVKYFDPDRSQAWTQLFIKKEKK